MLPKQILKIRVSKMAIFRILLRPISCSSSLLLFSSSPPSLPCSFFSCTNCCRDIFPTTQTVQGQLSPWFLVEAWLPFRNREMDYQIEKKISKIRNCIFLVQAHKIVSHDMKSHRPLFWRTFLLPIFGLKVYKLTSQFYKLLKMPRLKKNDDVF